MGSFSMGSLKGFVRRFLRITLEGILRITRRKVACHSLLMRKILRVRMRRILRITFGWLECKVITVGLLHTPAITEKVTTGDHVIEGVIDGPQGDAELGGDCVLPHERPAAVLPIEILGERDGNA